MKTRNFDSAVARLTKGEQVKMVLALIRIKFTKDK